MPSGNRFSSRQTLFEGESRIPLSPQLAKSKDTNFNHLLGRRIQDSQHISTMPTFVYL